VRIEVWRPCRKRLNIYLSCGNFYCLSLSRYRSWTDFPSLLNKTKQYDRQLQPRSIIEYTAAANGRLAHSQAAQSFEIYSGRQTRSQRIHAMTHEDQLRRAQHLQH